MRFGAGKRSSEEVTSERRSVWVGKGGRGWRGRGRRDRDPLAVEAAISSGGRGAYDCSVL